MASVSTYLNFPRNTEEVFNFYKTVFGGEFLGNGIMRFGDIPDAPGCPPAAEAALDLQHSLGRREQAGQIDRLFRRYPQAVARLRQFFEIAHIHYNNASCVADLAPFPSFAYEVLFVSKRLAVVDPSRKPARPHPEDARNNSSLADCQPPIR